MVAAPNVIVGEGMAPGVAVRRLRDEGYEGPITMMGEEPRVAGRTARGIAPAGSGSLS